MWCMYMYIVHKFTHVFCDACFVCINPHVFDCACMCILCMCMYIVHKWKHVYWNIQTYMFIGLSYIERPILGDNPEAHGHDNEKHTFFKWKACTFCEKHLLFSWKVCTFHEKHLHFSWKAPKSMLFIWEATKTADSTQIFHFDLVFIECRGKAN